MWYGQILFQVTFIVPSKYSTYNASILDGKVTVSTRIFCQWTEQIDVPWNSYSYCLKTIICIYSVELSLLECTFNPTSYRSMFFISFVSLSSAYLNLQHSQLPQNITMSSCTRTHRTDQGQIEGQKTCGHSIEVSCYVHRVYTKTS